VEWGGGFSGDFGGFVGTVGGDLPALGGEMGRATGGGTGGGLSGSSGKFGDGFTETDLVVILARKKQTEKGGSRNLPLFSPPPKNSQNS